MTPEQTIQKLEEMIAVVRAHMKGVDIISASVHQTDEFNNILLNDLGTIPESWTKESLCESGGTMHRLPLRDSNVEVRWFPQEASDAPD